MNPESNEAKRSIVVDYDLPQAPSKVWQALTDSGLLASWLMPNDFRAEVGHRFTFRTQPRPGFDGVIQCEVLAVELHKRLSYNWRGGALDTTVTWTLSPTPSGGTALHLEHSGFTAADGFAFEGLGKGWRGDVATRITQLLSQ
jgi:uncharacterized protein YndB with AHSA1/START domain